MINVNGTNGAEMPFNKKQMQIEKLLQIIENNLMCLREYPKVCVNLQTDVR